MFQKLFSQGAKQANSGEGQSHPRFAETIGKTAIGKRGKAKTHDPSK